MLKRWWREPATAEAAPNVVPAPPTSLSARRGRNVPAAKSAIIHYWLGHGTLVVAALHRILGHDVFYLHAEGLVRHPWVRDALAAAGIRWFDFMNFDEIDPALSIRFNAALAERVLKSIPTDALASVLPLFCAGVTAPDSITLQKLRICLYQELKTRLFVTARVEEIAHCLKRRYSNVAAFYVTDAAAALLLKQRALSFRPAPFSRWLNAVTAVRMTARLLGVAIRRVVSRSPRAAQRPSAATAVVAELPGVNYFPHQGLLYGDLFRKDFLYESDPASPLHPSRVLHVEFQLPSSATEQSYRNAGLRWRTLLPAGGVLSSGALLLKHFMRCRKLREMFSSQWLALFLPLAVLFRQYKAYQRGIDFIPGSVAVIGYDLLFPRVLAIALQAAGVRVIAAQERLQSAYYDGFTLILDHYLVAGRRVAEHLRMSEYCSVGQYHCIGLMRVDLFGDYKRVQRGRKQVLVLDYASPENWWENSDPLVNREANRQFYMDVIRTAIERPGVDFVIRGKSVGWLDDPFFRDIVAVISHLPNLRIDREYGELNRSYRLAAGSDCIVAKHTSLGDECLAVGKPVIFHDWSSNSRNYAAGIYDYEGLPVFAARYEQLLSMLDTALAPDSTRDAAWTEKLESILAPASAADVRARARAIIANQLAMSWPGNR